MKNKNKFALIASITIICALIFSTKETKFRLKDATLIEEYELLGIPLRTVESPTHFTRYLVNHPHHSTNVVLTGKSSPIEFKIICYEYGGLPSDINCKVLMWRDGLKLDDRHIKLKIHSFLDELEKSISDPDLTYRQIRHTSL